MFKLTNAIGSENARASEFRALRMVENKTLQLDLEQIKEMSRIPLVHLLLW